MQVLFRLDAEPSRSIFLISHRNEEQALPEAETRATTEVLFYHLERQGLEKVLPSLVEKTLERGWRAVVQAGSHERLAAIDLALWTYKEDSFLAHGTPRTGTPPSSPCI